MRTCILRKVVYRPSDSDKLTWGIVLRQNCGLSLLYVPRRSEQDTHVLVVCTENIEERLFEPVEGPQFPLEDQDLGAIGEKLSSLGEAIAGSKLAGELLEDL
jgi:hypothetical protein